MPTVPDFGGPSLEDSRLQIQKLALLSEEDYEQRQDPD